jgi:hypothetical protein
MLINKDFYAIVNENYKIRSTSMFTRTYCSIHFFVLQLLRCIGLERTTSSFTIGLERTTSSSTITVYKMQGDLKLPRSRYINS